MQTHPSRFERVALVVNGTLVLVFAALSVGMAREFCWLVLAMGIGLIATGLLNRCGTRAILERIWPARSHSEK